MSALLALRLVTYLMVCIGVAALYLANLIGAPGAALVVLAILVSWGHEQARERGAVRPALGWSLVATAAGAIAVDLFYLAYSLLDGMVHLLLFLILLRLFARRGLRDLRDAGLLSFFMLVAAASISFNPSFLFVFIAYFLLGTWMLILNHVVTELELAGRPGHATTTARRVFFRGPLTQVSLAAAVITFALAAGLFFVIPRVGQAALPLRASIGRMVTGFSDRVDLGSFGDIESDRSVVMRVYLADESLDPATLPGLRWRGVAFDHFDGRAWSSAAAPRRYLQRTIAGDFGLALPRGTGPMVRQEIYLEPIGSDAVFAAPRAARIELRSPSLVVDDMDGLTVSSPSARLHYVVDSEIDTAGRPLGIGRRASPALSAVDRARFVQLPSLPPEIERLAREVTAGSADAAAAAGRLSAHLSAHYRYTLALKRQTQTTLAPLEEFLFVRRSGNCEYFAAAMAVMLRSIGVPARVVAGFQQGEWNPYGRYFMVRLSDAHAWVEVHLDGRGWVAFDPSPRAEATADEMPGRVSLYLDAARMRWYRYVVNWSLRDQVQLAASVHRQAADARVALAWPSDWRVSPGVLTSAGLAVMVALLWGLRRYGHLVPRGGPAARVPAFYERALRLLARRGLTPGAAETARQFAARVEEHAPDRAAAFGRLTGYYERARFGDAPLSEAERQDVTRALAALGSR
jgi:transglutaminase-like putative cysteine protease